MKQKIGFKFSDDETAPFLDEVYFFHEDSIQLLSAKEVSAVLDLKMTIEMQSDPMAEENFVSLVEAAKHLEEQFKKTKKALGLK